MEEIKTEQNNLGIKSVKDDLKLNNKSYNKEEKKLKHD